MKYLFRALVIVSGLISAWCVIYLFGYAVTHIDETGMRRFVENWEIVLALLVSVFTIMFLVHKTEWGL